MKTIKYLFLKCNKFITVIFLKKKKKKSLFDMKK